MTQQHLALQPLTVPPITFDAHPTPTPDETA